MAQDVELESLLYAIGMESNTGYRHMEMLCDLLAVPYPPKNIGKPAPEKLVSTKENKWHLLQQTQAAETLSACPQAHTLGAAIQ